MALRRTSGCMGTLRSAWLRRPSDLQRSGGGVGHMVYNGLSIFEIAGACQASGHELLGDGL
jgi:hypothetical protein